MPQRNRGGFLDRLGAGLQGAVPGLSQLARDQANEDLFGGQQDAIADRQKNQALERLIFEVQSDVAAGHITSQQGQILVQEAQQRAEVLDQNVASGTLPEQDDVFGGLAPSPRGPSLAETLAISGQSTEQLGSGLASAAPANRGLFADALSSRTEEVHPEEHPGERAGFNIERDPLGQPTGRSFSAVRHGQTPKTPIGDPFADRRAADQRAAGLQLKEDEAFAGTRGAGRAELVTGAERAASTPPISPQFALQQGLTRAFQESGMSEGMMSSMGDSVMRSIEGGANPIAAIAAFGQGQGFDPDEFTRKVELAFTTANDLLESAGMDFRFGTPEPDDTGEPPPGDSGLEAVKAKVRAAGSSLGLEGADLALWNTLTTAQKLEVFSVQ